MIREWDEMYVFAHFGSSGPREETAEQSPASLYEHTPTGDVGLGARKGSNAARHIRIRWSVREVRRDEIEPTTL